MTSPTSGRPRPNLFLPAGAALACLVLAGAALAGWWLHSPLLIGAAPGKPQMYPLTALGFVFASVAILLHLGARPVPLALGRALALATLALGAGSALMRASE